MWKSIQLKDYSLVGYDTCSSVGRYKHCRGTCCLYISGRKVLYTGKISQQYWEKKIMTGAKIEPVGVVKNEWDPVALKISHCVTRIFSSKFLILHGYMARL
jgi:hypothetical protein